MRMLPENELIDMCDEQYFALDGYASSSSLKTLYRLSAKHILIPHKESAEKKMGTLSHVLTMENEFFHDRYVIEPEFNPTPDDKGKLKPKGSKWKTTNDYKEQFAEFMSQHEGKIAISQEEYDTGMEWTRAVYETEMANRFFLDIRGKAEQVILTEIEGVKVKVKIDWIIVDHDRKEIVAVDYKTARSASRNHFRKAIYYGDGKLGDYNMQSALYIKAMQNAFPGYDITWYWCVLEKSDIPQCCWYGQTEEAFEDGWKKVKVALDEWAPIAIDCYLGYEANREVVWL